jgi:hypothetical protein
VEKFFVDYLERLQTLNREFIETFEDLPVEALDWLPGVEMNSFCVLVVHTTGSARYWIGDVGMGELSNRNRAMEFQARGIGTPELKARFVNLEAYVRGALERLSLPDLDIIRQRTSLEGEVEQISVGWALLHALEHTGIHLGHAQITRQLWQQRS